MKKHIFIASKGKDEYPNVMIYGNDDARSKWFDKDDIEYIAEIIISRHSGDAAGINGTQVRDWIVENNILQLKKVLNIRIWGEIQNLRKELLYLK
jgi:hypothetical protein